MSKSDTLLGWAFLGSLVIMSFCMGLNLGASGSFQYVIPFPIEISRIALVRVSAIISFGSGIMLIVSLLAIVFEQKEREKEQ